jgi:type IV fimbrial biogenesis protein FimT
MLRGCGFLADPRHFESRTAGARAPSLLPFRAFRRATLEDGPPMRDCAGFTLWELVWTLLVASVLVGIAVPSFEAVSLDARRTASVNGLVLAIQVARSESAKRGRSVALCASADGLTCTAPVRDYSRGWIVFVNDDGDRPPRRSPDEPLVYSHQPDLIGTILANRDVFEFSPYYARRSTNGTVVFCDRRGTAAARAVIVSYTGRPRVDGVAADGSALPCARLP